MRNLKRDYIEKIRKIEAPNGYKFDILNYLHNPDYDYDYPCFKKMIDEDETTETFRKIYYFKYWDGTGRYFSEDYKIKKDGGRWQVVDTISNKELYASNRFNINKLLSFCK